MSNSQYERIKQYNYPDTVPKEWKLYIRKDVQAMLDAFWDADAEEAEDLKYYDSDTSERL